MQGLAVFTVMLEIQNRMQYVFHYFMVILPITAMWNMSIAQESNLPSKIAEAAMDSLYHEYRLLSLAHQENIVMKKYNLAEIGSVLAQGARPFYCDESNEAIAHIRGAELYKLYQCQLHDIFTRLQSKYPEVFNGDINVANALVRYYDEVSAEYSIEMQKSINRVLLKR